VIPTVSDFFSKLFRWHSPEDLRWHLATLVFVVLLPALIFSTLVVLFVLRLEREAAERGVKETARAVALSVDRELASAISALKVLATSDHLTRGDFGAFYEQAKSEIISDGPWIVLFDETAQQLVNTGFPLGSKLPRRNNPERVLQIIASRQVDVSDLYRSYLFPSNHPPWVTIIPLVVFRVAVTVDIS
jgi:hypothetical protein